MVRLSRIIFVPSAILGFMLTTGCATPKIPYSGFLKDYSCFQACALDKPERVPTAMGPIAGADLVYVKEDVKISAFTKVMVDPVVFRFHEDAKPNAAGSQELQRLRHAFHEAMADALEDAYPLVDESGPDVLRVRVAITEVVPSNPLLNTVSSISPVGLTVSTIKKGLTGSHACVGQASMEVEILASETNERLAAAIDVKPGEKYKFIQGLQKWGHAVDAFRFWALGLREWLDSAHGRSVYSCKEYPASRDDCAPKAQYEL